MKKRCYLLTLLLILTCSCTLTNKLWNRSYKENFYQFLLDSEGEKLVFLGTDYHYIFDDHSRSILNVLNSEGRQYLFVNTKKTYISLNNKNQIRANVLIEVIDNSMLSHEEYHSLESLGFRNNEEGNLALTLELRGLRYSAANWRSKSLAHLNRTYVIDVHYDNTLFTAIGKAALTPITITADAVLLIGKTVLFPLKSN